MPGGRPFKHRGPGRPKVAKSKQVRHDKTKRTNEQQLQRQVDKLSKQNEQLIEQNSLQQKQLANVISSKNTTIKRQVQRHEFLENNFFENIENDNTNNSEYDIDSDYTDTCNVNVDGNFDSKIDTFRWVLEMSMDNMASFEQLEHTMRSNKKYLHFDTVWSAKKIANFVKFRIPILNMIIMAIKLIVFVGCNLVLSFDDTTKKNTSYQSVSLSGKYVNNNVGIPNKNDNNNIQNNGIAYLDEYCKATDGVVYVINESIESSESFEPSKKRRRIMQKKIYVKDSDIATTSDDSE